MLGLGGWVRSEESNTHCCLANVRLALMAELSRLREERVLHLRRIELLTARVEQLSVCGVVFRCCLTSSLWRCHSPGDGPCSNKTPP